MSAVALTQAVLDARTCEACGSGPHTHDALVFASVCHPGVPTWASYADGQITLNCAACDKVVAVIAVARS